MSTPPTFIMVTDQHISDGVRADCEKCPVALAVSAAIRVAGYAPEWVEAEIETIDVGLPGERWQADTPPIAADFMADFDNCNPVAPFNFTLTWRAEPDPEAAS